MTNEERKGPMDTTPDPPERTVRVMRAPTTGQFFGACSCGWLGHHHWSPRDAEYDASEHDGDHDSEEARGG